VVEENRKIWASTPLCEKFRKEKQKRKRKKYAYHGCHDCYDCKTTAQYCYCASTRGALIYRPYWSQTLVLCSGVDNFRGSKEGGQFQWTFFSAAKRVGSSRGSKEGGQFLSAKK